MFFFSGRGINLEQFLWRPGKHACKIVQHGNNLLLPGNDGWQVQAKEGLTDAPSGAVVPVVFSSALWCFRQDEIDPMDPASYSDAFGAYNELMF